MGKKHSHAFQADRILPLFAVLGVVTLALSACNSSTNPEGNQTAELRIENGQFEVDATVIRNSGLPGANLGAGTLSFDYSGDATGSFAASGRLLTNMSDSSGVGAILDRVNNLDLNKIDEGFSLLGFFPRGDGKADILLLGTRVDFPLDTLEAGKTYFISPSGPFNGLFLRGIDIPTFWAGQTSLAEQAEQAFVLQTGGLFVSARDSSHVAGTFFGATNPNGASATTQAVPGTDR